MPNTEKAQQIWVRCFDDTTNRVRISSGTANPPADTSYQWQEVLNRSFDPTENRLRVD